MADTLQQKQNRPIVLLTEQMVLEAKWWADNRFASVKEPYPITPYKKMSKAGLESLISSMVTTDEIQKDVEELRAKSIKRYETTVFDRNRIELNFGNSECYKPDLWLAYLHYSKEQHEIQACKGNDSRELRDHIRQHGQLVKNG